MTILELTDKKAILLEEVRTKVSAIQLEKRKLNETEDNEVETMLAEVEDLNKQIAEAEEARDNETDKFKTVNIITKNKEEKMEKKFSIGELVQRNLNSGNYRFDVPVAEREFRAEGQSATTDAGGGYTVETEIWDLVKPLTNNLVTVAAGAKVHTGLQGDVAIDTMNSPSLAWAEETGSATATSTTFSQATFTPHRLTATLDISQQLINQSVFAVDQIIEQEMVRQVAQKLEGALFSEANVSNAANSIMTSLSDISGSVTYANMIALETYLANANNLFGAVKYITNSAGIGKLKSTVRVSSTDSRFMLEGDMLNGYPILQTNAIKSTYGAGNDEAAVILADWNDLNIYNFGQVNVLVDPYTQAANGKIRLVLQSFWDAGFHRSTSKQVGSFGL